MMTRLANIRLEPLFSLPHLELKQSTLAVDELHTLILAI